jgi:hypothetical protein
MDEVESPVIGRKSLETSFQSPAIGLESLAIGFQSLACGLQSLEIGIKNTENRAKTPCFINFHEDSIGNRLASQFTG